MYILNCGSRASGRTFQMLQRTYDWSCIAPANSRIAIFCASLSQANQLQKRLIAQCPNAAWKSTTVGRLEHPNGTTIEFFSMQDLFTFKAQQSCWSTNPVYKRFMDHSVLETFLAGIEPVEGFAMLWSKWRE